jgi:hypothetical protein
MADFGIFCGDITTIQKVNLNGNTPSNGEIWSVWTSADPNRALRRCITIQDSTATTTDPTPFLVSEYTDCYDCMSNNYYVIVVRDCIGNNQYVIPIYEFGFLPVAGETYYFEITNVNNSQFFSCFTVTDIKLTLKPEFDKLIADDRFQFINGTPSSLSYETCEPCLSGNSFTYEVTRCTDGATDYVPLINDSFVGHLISYSDGIDEYCGVVGVINPETTTFVFINDYGLSETEGGSVVCDDCLATENQKILLQSCTDTEYTEVVWASTLFDSGDISNLSTDSGCFEVVGLTENDVTINSYLNFDPQPGCEPCIECNGINYSYITCSGDTSGDFKSYQYLPIGTKFYNPAIDECCEVTGTASSYYDTLYSVETFTGCTECENNVDVVIWNASACTNSNTYSSFYVTTDSTAQAGDTVKLMWGSNEWICAGLINTASSYSGGYTYYNTQKNGLGSTLIYDSCENCNSQGLIGVTLVNCDSGVESFVSITLDNYLSIYNFGSISNYSVKDSNGSCYQISNLCPIPLEEQDFTPVEFYLSCIFCEPFDPNTPRSANTETYICNYCCDCGASGETITQIVPPHPIWSDGYGTWVTQMNMVLIGSGNGLNA